MPNTVVRATVKVDEKP